MKNKKKLLKMFSICMAISIMLTNFIFPELFVSALDNAFTGQLLELPDNLSNTDNFNYQLKMNSTELTPEISGMHLSFGWNGKSTKDNVTYYFYTATVNDNTTDKTYDFEEGNAIMFYAKMPFDSPDNQLYVQFNTSNYGDDALFGKRQYMSPVNGGKIYYLQKGEKEWTERPAPQSTVDPSRGNVLLPAGFEGWIRIPYSSTNCDKAKSNKVFRIEYMPKILGGDYTSEPLQIGSFMFLKDGTESFTNVSFDGATSTSLLVELDSYNTKILFPQDVEGASEVDNETVISKGYTYALDDKNVNMTFTEEASILEAGSILTYVRLPIYNSSGVTVTLNGAAPKKGVECAFFDRGKKDWESIVTADNGKLMLPDSFEGYLMIPASAYDVTESAKIEKVGFEFDEVGCRFGSVMISDSTERLNVITLDIDPRPCYLIKKAYYRGELLGTETETTDNIANNIYYDMSQKKDDAEFSIGIDNGYYYEMTPGSADIGEYSIKSDGELPAYTTTALASIANTPVRPSGNTAFTITSEATTELFPSIKATFAAGTAHTKPKDSEFLNLETGVYNNPDGFNSDYRVDFSFEPISWSSVGAIMFYVKSTGTADTKMFIMNANKWVYLTKDKEYYILREGGDEWEACTAVAFKGDMANFVIPAGFEGWIRIPTTSMANNGKPAAEHNFAKFQLFPSLLGGEYGEVTVSNFATVIEGNQDFFALKLLGTNEQIKISDAEIQKKFNVNISSIAGEKTFTTNAIATDMYSTINLTESRSFASGEALMFYVKQTGRVKSYIRMQLEDSGMKLEPGAAYFTYDSTTQSWSESGALDSGKLEIPAGFSGWIRIPYDSFTDATNTVDPDGFTIEKIFVSPYQLGGPYGTIKIGSFMIANHGNEQLPTMRVNKADEAALTVMNAYTARVLTPDNALAIGENARKIEAVAQSWPLLDGGYNYKVVSRSLGVTMDGTSGVEVELTDFVKIKQEDCVILYVKLPAAKANQLILDGALKLAASKEVYTISKSEKAWSQTATTADGYIDLKAGFDGYIRIPFASLANKIEEGIDKFVIGFKNVGEEYGEPIFGSVMISNNARLNCTDIYVDEIEYSQTLLQENQLTGYLMQGTMANSGDSANIISVSSTTNPNTADIPETYTYSINAKEDIRLDNKTVEPRVRFTVNELYRSTMASSGGIMFYVSIPEGTENTMHFQVKADAFVTLASAARYTVLEKGNAYWQEKVATNNGDITFSSGFSGWVKIPYTSLTASSGAYIGGPIENVNFAFRKLGGEYGNPTISCIMMLANHGDFDSIKLSGYDTPITLFGDKAKITYDRNDIAIWESVLNPFEGYKDQDAFPLKAEIDANTESEATSTFAAKVLTGVTPFAAKGFEIASSNHVQFTPNHHPMLTFTSPFTVRDGKGIVIYVKLPDNGIETNEFYLQIKTAAGKWLSFKKPLMGAYLQKGETDWLYALRDDQEILLPSGFEGYVYYPFESLTTYDNSITGEYFALTDQDVAQQFSIGVGDMGGDYGEVLVGGVFLSKNGVLSHNAAYVDGDTVCRDVFLGTALKEDDVCYSIYDVPNKTDIILPELPASTQSEYFVDIAEITISSADLIFDKYPGAAKYRVDLYKFVSIETSMTGVYNYVKSVWTDTNSAYIDNLSAGVYYTAVVSAFDSNNKGLCIYPYCSIYPEGKIVGDMNITKDDTYKYGWDDGEDEEYEYYYEEIEIEGEQEDITKKPTKPTKVKKVLKRRVASDGIEPWLITLIIVAAVFLVGGIATLIIILAKRKKKEVQI